MSIAHGVRTLRRAPGFSLLVIGTLAVGIGVTSAAFSAAWAVFLRPLPLPHQERLVTVWQVDAQSPGVRERVTPANFVDWEAESRSFDAMGVLPNWTGEPWFFNVGSATGLERVRGIYASSGFFRVLGVEPIKGRTFTSDDDRTRGARHMVISHRFWMTWFGGDPNIIGREVDVDTFRGGAFTIVGVMPPAFDLPRAADIWLSLADWGGGPMPAPGAAERCCAWYTVVGRLKPDVTVEQARAELSAIAARVSQAYPSTRRPDVQIVSLREMLVGEHRLSFLGLVGAVACILLLACANVANLLLSRAVSRRREILTRLALGATRARLARQLLGESLVSGAIGAGAGMLLSSWAQAAIRAAMADRVPFIDETRVDMTVVAFSTAVAFAVSVVCGLVPLIDWHAVDWNARGQTESRTSRRFRHALVIAQIAIAVAVVACAGLLVKTVSNLRAIDVGFDTSRTLVVKTDVTTAALRGRGAAAQFMEQLIPRLASLPGVASAGATTAIPFEAGQAAQAITREGDVPRPAALSPHIVQSAVTPGYFSAMGIVTRRGRTFDDRDRADARLVAVINDTAAGDTGRAKIRSASALPSAAASASAASVRSSPARSSGARSSAS
jgi:putative ABC transport system permease protein